MEKIDEKNIGKFCDDNFLDENLTEFLEKGVKVCKEINAEVIDVTTHEGEKALLRIEAMLTDD